MDFQQEWPYVDTDWINLPHNLEQAFAFETTLMGNQVPFASDEGSGAHVASTTTENFPGRLGQ